MSTPVELIKDKLSIVDVVSAYVKLERAGIYHKARCPFHSEKTASFFLSPDRGTYHCFGCGKGGDIFSFVQDIEGMDFPAALRLLADRAGVTLDARAKRESGEKSHLSDCVESAVLFYEKELRGAAPAIDYLKSRGITGATAKKFRIGFAPDGWENLTHHLRSKGWQDSIIETAGLALPGKTGLYDRFRGRLMFPIFSAQGKAIGFTGRVLPGADSEQGKYVNSPETPLYHKSSVLYGLNFAKQEILKKGSVVVVEGQMDLILAHQAGTENIVAVSGTAFTEEHVRMLSRFTDKVIFCFDSDAAGRAALEKATLLVLRTGLTAERIEIENGKDPADLILENPKLWEEALEKTKPVIDSLINDIQNDTDEINAKIRHVKSTVLPLIAALSGVMEQSVYVKKISQTFGITENSVTEDLKKIAKKEVGETEPIPVKVIRSAKIVAAERIVGFESTFKMKVDCSGIEAPFKESMGISLSEFLESLPSERRDALAFEAELYYGTSEKLPSVLQDMLAALILLYYDETLADTLRKLREVERDGRTEEAEKLHAITKELGEKIYKIKETSTH